MISFGFSPFLSLDEAIIALARETMAGGRSASPRGMATKEIGPVAFQLTDPRRRYCSIPERHWSVVLAVGELAWHLAGSNEVDFIRHYASKWAEFSDDGRVIAGSCYGRKIFSRFNGCISEWDQLAHLLKADPHTRRAIVYFNKEDSQFSTGAKDVSCTSSIQFFLRNDRLDAVVSMRSNDLIWGAPYDIFLFTMMQEMMATLLDVQIGTYFHVAASMHVYERHFQMAEDICVTRGPAIIDPMPAMEGLAAVPSFLAGEEKIRGAKYLKSPVDVDSAYWKDLLRVLQAPIGGQLDFSWKSFEDLLRLRSQK